MAPKIAIIFYSTWGHVQKLAEAEKKGIEEAGGTADLYRIEETLSQEVLSKMHAPPHNDDIPTLSDPKIIEQYDAFLFGIPTRYGNFPAQWKVFWDKTGGQWQTGAYWGKYAGLFISTGTMGGGQESTAIAAMSTLAHHGFIFVPLGYKTTFHLLGDISEVRGGSPWGAGTFSAADGSRQPTEKELQLATEQGKAFYGHVSKVNFGGAAGSAPAKTEPKPTAQQQSSTTQQTQPTTRANEAEKKDEEKGPCGLPIKCTIA